MLACHCRGVNDKAVRAAIHAGATNLEALAQLCRAGSGCGGCHATLEALLRLAATDPEQECRRADSAILAPA